MSSPDEFYRLDKYADEDSRKPMKNSTRIAVILDRSGSMASAVDSTIEGYNTFLKSQKEVPGECQIKFVQFDTVYEQVYDLPLVAAPLLSRETFVPRGGTALYDAIGFTVQSLGDSLAKLTEAERPEHVIVVIMTDGGENSSYKYRREQIGAIIAEQQTKYNWQFVFIGANQDALLTAQSLNIPAQFAMNYSAQSAGSTAATYGIIGANVSSLRSGGRSDMSFTADQTAAADPQKWQNKGEKEEKK